MDIALEQARKRRPRNLETPWEHDTWDRLFSELAYRLFHTLGELARRNARARQITWIGQLTEADWGEVEHYTLSPMARALLQKAEREEQAEAEAAERRYLRRVGQGCQVWVNQGLRDAVVLAILGNEALIEYAMPQGTTALRIVHRENPEALVRVISLKALPQRWLQEIAENGIPPTGNTQPH